MAIVSFMDPKDLQNYELALNRLGASKASKKRRPIVERGKPVTQQEAVSIAARALAALWGKRKPGSGGGSR